MIQCISDNVNIFIALGAIATAVSIVWLCIQALATRKTYLYSKTWNERNKAVELAWFYQNRILGVIAYIDMVFTSTGVSEDIARAGLLDEFTSYELKEKTGTYTFDEKILDCVFSDENKKNVIIASILCENSGITPLHQHTDRVIMESMFMDDVESLLNSMEYFSMCFVSGVANEEVVYQSLHQSFLKCVKLLSRVIARSNTSPKNQYYTYLTKLYKTWSDRDIKRGKKQSSLISIVKGIKK